MKPDVKKHYDDTHALMEQIVPMFYGVHSVTMMMVLADLIARWIVMHPPEDMTRLAATLTDTVRERLLDFLDDEVGTRH